MSDVITRGTPEEVEARAQQQLEEINQQIEQEDNPVKSLERSVQRQRELDDAKFESADEDAIGVFLILVEYNDDNSTRNWEITTGREETYQYIKDNIDVMDLVESKVVASTLSFTKAFSCAQYLIDMIESGKIEDPGFDPRDYIPADFEEEDD